jgi:hypothetical protein
MAAADWSELANSASSTLIARGTTGGITRPNGGGDFLYGFNSKTVAPVTAGLYCDLTGFNPTAEGGSISMAIKRGVGGGDTEFSPFMFIGLQTADVSGEAYILGLADSDPHHIVLKKGALSALVSDLAPDPANNGILLRSSEAYDNDTWLHLQLTMIVQGSGDVLLQCKASDLDTEEVYDPTFEAIPGMDDFTDDALGVNSGSDPFIVGYVGFGFHSEDITRRGYVDHVVITRQT